MALTFDEYQKQAKTTVVEQDSDFHQLIEQVLGLGDEAGEVQAIFKKWIRDTKADPDALDRTNVKKELGDVLWYIAVISEGLDISFDELAQANLDKLADRMARGVIGGSGDNR